VEPATGSHTLEAVSPGSVEAGHETTVTIRGDGFDPKLVSKVGCGGETIDLDDGFEVLLDDEPLGGFEWIDSSTMRGRVPPDMDPGMYDVTVADPDGRIAVLEDAFEVLDGSTDADTDSDSDSDSDTDTDSVPPDGDGSGCEEPLLMEVDGETWTGAWGGFGQTFTPSNACGTGDQDIWFAAYRPAGRAIAVSETGPVDVLLRHIDDCVDLQCLEWVDEPEWICVAGSSQAGWELMVVTEKGSAGSTDSAIVKLEVLPGLDCAL